LFAAVADGSARRVDAAGQRRFRDDPPAPDRLQEIVLADDAVAILHQIDQEVEDLRLDRDQPGAVAQLAPAYIECVVAEDKLYVGSVRALCRAFLRRIGR
jgi:hypothetical protein